MIDYYKVLNVAPDASTEALNEQRRFLLNAFHPDIFGKCHLYGAPLSIAAMRFKNSVCSWLDSLTPAVAWTGRHHRLFVNRPISDPRSMIPA